MAPAGSAFALATESSGPARGERELRTHLLDVSAVWRVSEKLETYLAIDNLTDERYEQFVGFESRGILPRAGVRLVF